MKKLIMVAIAVSLLAGCAQRNLNNEDRAAILGASMNQAMQNAHDAAYGEGAYSKHKKHYDND